MYEERTYHHTPYGEGEFRPSGGGRHRAPEETFQERFPEHFQEHFQENHRADFQQTLVPPEPGWDPAEELAFLLRDAMEQQPAVPYVPHVADTPAPAPPPGTPPGSRRESAAEPPPSRDSPTSHRRIRQPKVSRLRAASLFLAALTSVIAASVTLFGGMVAYEPLRLAAVTHAHGGVVSWWPVLVYGPWLMASLAVLRAALHRHRALHSWAVVLLFSAIAMLLCIAEAPRTLTDGAAAALPGLASLICFQQIIRQITLTRPPRRVLPRHRQGLASAPDDEATGAAGTDPVSLPQQRRCPPGPPRPGAGPARRT